MKKRLIGLLVISIALCVFFPINHVNALTPYYTSYYLTGYGVTTFGYGTYAQPLYILGYQDGRSMHIHCSDYDDGVQVIGTFNQEFVQGNIYVYGYSGSGYYSDLYVYISNDGVNWDLVGMQTISSATPSWKSFGDPGVSFKYICLTGYDSGYSVCLYLDCVLVQTLS